MAKLPSSLKGVSISGSNEYINNWGGGSRRTLHGKLLPPAETRKVLVYRSTEHTSLLYSRGLLSTGDPFIKNGFGLAMIMCPDAGEKREEAAASTTSASENIVEQCSFFFFLV